MRIQSWVRRQITRRLYEEEQLVLRSGPLTLAPHFQEIDAFGLYLHIPFCRQICPYCPYNKEIYQAAVAEEYTAAVLREIAHYAPLVGNRPITSFYIGGGTPTTMLYGGLPQILDAVDRTFNRQCAIHMESHPNDLSDANLAKIIDLGVEHLSIGIEALQDHHLRNLCRPYSTAEAQAAVARAVNQGFRSVNVDLMFALPDQSHQELRAEVETLLALGVDQIATYPLFDFPYTQWPQLTERYQYRRYNLLQKRHMLRVIEEACAAAGYERSSVWAFTRRGVPPYCSVTVPLYLGLGASAASYLRDIFYVNTFNVGAYIEALAEGRMPIALSLPLSLRQQMAGWLYWRIYATRFSKADFAGRFHVSFDEIYGKYLKPLARLGLLHDDGNNLTLTANGAYWLHAVQDLFSIDYVSTLWGTAREQPWPEEVLLTT